MHHSLQQSEEFNQDLNSTEVNKKLFNMDPYIAIILQKQRLELLMLKYELSYKSYEDKKVFRCQLK